MMTYWGNGGIAPLIVNLGVVNSNTGRFNPGERSPGTHWIGGMKFIGRFRRCYITEL